MRIAFVSQEYPPETAKGGIGSQTYLKARGLAALGHEVHVISRSTSGARWEYVEHDVHVVRIPGLEKRMPVYTEVADWLTYSGEVATAVAQLHERDLLEIVDFPEWGAEAYVHLLNRTEWNRVPTVIQLHGPLVMFAHTMGWPELDSDFYRIGTLMEGTCLRLADAVFSSSRCSADWCAKHYGLDRQAIPVLHTGVDTDLFSPRHLPKASRPTVIFVGQLAANKGVPLLLRAICSLGHDFPDLQLRVIGRGERKIINELKSLAAAAGRQDALDLVGFVPREELPEHLCQAHLFAAPSLYEGGPGFVYLEAMACGLPVIACEGSGISEVVQHGENGLLVSPSNVEALAQAIRRLLSDSRERELMGQRARQFVLNEADSRDGLRKLESFYASVASGEPMEIVAK